MFETIPETCIVDFLREAGLFSLVRMVESSMQFLIWISSQMMKSWTWACSHNWTIKSDWWISRRLWAAVRDPYFWRTADMFCRIRVVINTLRPKLNGRHFPDDIFKCIFLNENVWILITISLKIVPKGLINNIPALVQIMAWRRCQATKPLSEPMMVSLLTHIYLARPQTVK